MNTSTHIALMSSFELSLFLPFSASPPESMRPRSVSPHLPPETGQAYAQSLNSPEPTATTPMELSHCFLPLEFAVVAEGVDSSGDGKQKQKQQGEHSHPAEVSIPGLWIEGTVLMTCFHFRKKHRIQLQIPSPQCKLSQRNWSILIKLNICLARLFFEACNWWSTWPTSNTNMPTPFIKLRWKQPKNRISISHGTFKSPFSAPPTQKRLFRQFRVQVTLLPTHPSHLHPPTPPPHPCAPIQHLHPHAARRPHRRRGPQSLISMAGCLRSMCGNWPGTLATSHLAWTLLSTGYGCLPRPGSPPNPSAVKHAAPLPLFGLRAVQLYLLLLYG